MIKQTDKFQQQQKKINDFFKKQKQIAKDLTELYYEFEPCSVLLNSDQVKTIFDQVFGTKALKKDLTYQQAYLANKMYMKLIEGEESPIQYFIKRGEIATRWKKKGHKNG